MRLSPLIAVVFLFILAGVLLGRAMKDNSDSPRFRDVLKDGQKREQLVARMNPQSLDKLSDSEVRQIVEAYVKTQHQSPEYWQVRQLKDQAVPFLIEVLKRPESFVKPHPKGALDESPAERALNMLWPHPPEAIIPLLLPCVDSNEEWQRKAAARHLGATGKAAVKDAVTKLLADPGDFVRSAAVMGVFAANKANRAEPALLTAVFEPLKPLTTRNDKAMIANDAAELLLQIDRRRAREFLTSASVITGTNANLGPLLEILTQEQVPVPAELLLQIVENTTAEKGRRRAAFGEALKNLALQKHSAVEGLIQKTFAEPPAPDEARLPSYLQTRFIRRKCAAQALCILNDMHDPLQTAFSNEEKLGLEKLPRSQQRLVLVVHLNGQVGNGGFAQYFFNTSDDPAQVVLALEDIGAPECARIFRDAASIFGKSGPSRDTEIRQRQLEKLSSKQDRVLDKADQQWFAASKDLDALLYLYALKSKKDFLSL